MKTPESIALDELRAIDPSRSFCVGRDEWSHSHGPNEFQDGREIRQRISILPGFNGESCSSISVPVEVISRHRSAPSLAAAVRIVRIHLHPYVPQVAQLPVPL